MPRSLTDFPAHGEGEKSANAATGASHSRIPSFLRSRIVQALIVVAFLIVIIVPPAVILTGGDGGSSDGGESGSGDSRPNIIFVLVDDQDSRMNSIDHMPLLRKHMIDQGTTFPNHYCTSALCCPARAVIWTGRNAHNTNITALAPPYGGYPKFVRGGFNENNLPVWMQDAGYQTYYVGKLMNSYNNDNFNQPCPKGWTGSEFLVDPFTYSYRAPATSRNCEAVQRHQGSYNTDLLANSSFAFMDDALESDAPFFMAIAPAAPHSRINDRGSGPPIPAEKYADMFQDEQIPRISNFNPDEQSGASWVRELSQLDDQTVDRLDEYHRLRLRALQSVDEMVDNLFKKLESTGQIDNTYVFYSSDNGFHLGHHRMRAGKSCGYEEDVNVPLIVRGPGVPKSVTSNAVTAHVDLAPTFLQLAGIDLRDDFDGSPIVVSGSTREVQTSKLEHANIEFWSNWVAPGERLGRVNNTYKSVRLIGDGYNLYYSVWCTNEHELYDMTEDPGQMNNLFGSGFTQQAAQRDRSSTNLGVTDYQLASRLDSFLFVLKSCKGGSCRGPWEALMPGRNVTTLRGALQADHDTFFAQDVQRIEFSRCENGHIVSAEGPQFELFDNVQSTLALSEDWYVPNNEPQWITDDGDEPDWSLWN